MPYDRDSFFERVRASPFDDALTQGQVDGMNFLLDTWEWVFEGEAEEQSTMWLAYCLATAFHETAATMRPIEEYGKGEGKSYGEPAGPFNQCYYGRGHVQLTWEDNYKRAQEQLFSDYGIEVELHEFPDNMLEDETSALVLFDGMIEGWFTGETLGEYFNEMIEDPVNARKIVNGLDKAELIAGYYHDFKAALVEVQEPEREEDEDDAA